MTIEKIFKPKNDHDIKLALFSFEGHDKNFLINLYNLNKELFSKILNIKLEISMIFSIELIIKTLNSGEVVGPFSLKKHLNLILELLSLIGPYKINVIEKNSVNNTEFLENIYYIELRK